MSGAEAREVAVMIANGLQFPPYRQLQTFPSHAMDQFEEAEMQLIKVKRKTIEI